VRDFFDFAFCNKDQETEYIAENSEVLFAVGEGNGGDCRVVDL